MNETLTNSAGSTNQPPLNLTTVLSQENIDRLTQLGLNLLYAILILIIGAWVAKIVKGSVSRVLNRRKMDPIIIGFVANLTYVILMVAVVLAALGQLGIQTTSFVAIIGAAGLAIGLALQGALSNFAAGFLMIIFRPFKKGDYVEAGGTAGIVDEIQVFTTVLNTPDNRRVIVPNSKVMGDNITNYSAKDTRRMDLNFGVSYSDDIPKVKQVLQRIVDEDSRVLKDPAAQILVGELADSSVNFIMRVWVKSPDYWPFKFETTEKVKITFDKEGISIPFPQRDVHLFQAK